MPIYTYICNKCKIKFDLLIGVTSEKTKLKCKSCGSTSIEKTFAPFGINTSTNNKQSSCDSCSSNISGRTCPYKKQ